MSIHEMEAKAARLEGSLRDFASALIPSYEIATSQLKLMPIAAKSISLPQPAQSLSIQGFDDYALGEALGWIIATNGNDLFHPDSDVFKVFAAITSVEDANLLCRLWLRNIDYPQPLRGNRFGQWISTTQVMLLKDYIKAIAKGFSFEQYIGDLKNGMGLYFDDFETELLAYILDEKSDIQQVYSVLCGMLMKSPGGIPLVALIKCHRRDAHEYVCKMLLDCNLERDLFDFDEREDSYYANRILRSFALGSREALLHIFHFIQSNDLFKHRAIRQAFCEWTGFGRELTAEENHSIKTPGMNLDRMAPDDLIAAFTNAHKCLTDSAYKDECQRSNDLIKIYMSLWVDEIYGHDKIFPAITALIRSGSASGKYAALYKAHSLDSAHFRVNTGIEVFKHRENLDDQMALGLAVKCITRSLAYLFPPIMSKKDSIMDSGMQDIFALTPEEFERLNQVFREILNEFPFTKHDDRIGKSFLTLGISMPISCNKRDLLEIAKWLDQYDKWKWRYDLIIE